MTFTLSSSKSKYHKLDDADLIAKLSACQAEFEDYHGSTEWSVMDFVASVEINSLEDLQSLQKEFHDESLIVDFSKQTIEIYNARRED